MIFHALRLIGWHDSRIWEMPLLWVLYLGYDLLVAGYGLTAQAKFGGTLLFFGHTRIHNRMNWHDGTGLIGSFRTPIQPPILTF